MMPHGMPGTGDLGLAWALLAAGLLLAVLPDATRQRIRSIGRVNRAAGVTRLLARFGRGRTRMRAGSQRPDTDALHLAASWDLLAACLHAGMPVPAAVRAVAASAPSSVGRVLTATADLLALGADPAQAWEQGLACPETAEFARAACRTARSGTALADVASDLAVRVRAGAQERVQARAQRVGVLMTGPLGLCFLPAFLCLGVIPVVLGLASQLSVLQ